MFVKIKSCATIGLNSELVEIEADIAPRQQTAFLIVGLTDAAIQEAKERVRFAIENSGFLFPRHKLTINLAPANLRKEGSVFDLAMAIAILKVNQTLTTNLDDCLFLGELALNGETRSSAGILPATIFAQKSNYKNIFIPADNKQEASLISNINIFPVKNLTELVNHLQGNKQIQPLQNSKPELSKPKFETDMSDIRGQEQAKRGLEIAAAGTHNLLLNGPPGSGKTLLARTLPTVLPPLSEAEIIEITKIYSIANLLQPETPVINCRPFRSPHHTSSGAALVGGGRIPKPGEISLAHRGVLFLDEFPEFTRQVLENLRQPLEDGLISVSRAQGTLTFPARFTLIASQNPCPCGYASDPEKECHCTPAQISKYQKKISGPILDRIDLHIEVPRLDYKKLTQIQETESSDQIRKRVTLAKNIQLKRFSQSNTNSNAEMTPKEINKFCKLNKETQNLLNQAVDQLQLSPRAYFRILKVARTIADLAKSEELKLSHVAEALQYRNQN